MTTDRSQKEGIEWICIYKLHSSCQVDSKREWMEGKNDRSCQKKGLMDEREREREEREKNPEKREDPI